MNIKEQMTALGPWYHDIEIVPGVRTEGWKGIAHVWQHIRGVREKIKPQYTGANVLDLGSRDGMWAFEAEELGAKNVVALELGVMNLLDRFLFARTHRNSRVIPCYGADAERVDEFTGQFSRELGEFDIVQHFGLLYHLKNPIRSLESVRRVMKTGGTLILETAGAEGQAPVMLSNEGSQVYVDEWTYWAPTARCMTYMLKESGFAQRDMSVLHDDTPRLCLTADAI